MHKWCLAALAALSLTVNDARAENLIANGGFEKPVAPDGSATCVSAGGSISKWIVIGTARSCYGYHDYSFQGYAWQAHSGNQIAGIAGRSGIRQSVPTVPGQLYTLSYWQGNHFWPGKVASNTVQVFIDDLLSMSTTNSADNGILLAWKKYSLVFSAQSAHTSIAFLSNETDPNSAMVTLDDIVVSPVGDE